MKNSGECVKCKSTDIIRVPFTLSGHAPNAIPMGLTVFSLIGVTRYVCGDCGFSEDWIDSAEDLRKVKEKYQE